MNRNIKVFRWLSKNKEWLFSGLGVALITIIIGFFLSQKNDKKPTAQKGDKNISSDNNLIGDKNIVAGRDVFVGTENLKNEGELEITKVRMTHEREFDVILRNLGDIDLVISKIEIKKLEDYHEGMNPILRPSAKYKIDVDDIEVGKTKGIDISHVIEANKADRILLATQTTNFYKVQVTFYYNKDRSVSFIRDI